MKEINKEDLTEKYFNEELRYYLAWEIERDFKELMQEDKQMARRLLTKLKNALPSKTTKKRG